MSLTRTIEVMAPTDRRNSNPHKNYGVSGITLVFVVKGEAGAVSFSILTGSFLPQVATEFFEKAQRDRHTYNPFQATAGAVDYHSPKPIREWQHQTDSRDCCYVTGGKCWSDGSALAGEDYLRDFYHFGPERVFEKLEGYYRSVFEGEN